MRSRKHFILKRIIGILALFIGFMPVTSKAETMDRISVYNADSEKPVIDKESITLSATSGTRGDVINISVKITDNVGISRTHLQLKNIETSKEIYFNNPSYDSATQTYNYSFEITDDIPNGHWYVMGIVAYDEAENSDVITFKENQYVIEINESTSDSEKPMIDEKSMTLSATSGTIGDVINISVKITDNVGISRTHLQLKNIETSKEIYFNNPSYDSATQTYNYSFEITDDIPNGHWYVMGIVAYDEAENSDVITFKENQYVIEINESTSDSEKPMIDEKSMTLSATSGTIGDVINISVKITDNVGISRTHLQLKNIETSKEIYFNNPSYDSATQTYNYSFEITDDIPNGHWYVMGIVAYDEAENSDVVTFKENQYVIAVSEQNKDIHTWDNGSTVKKSTCSTTGVKKYICIICNISKTETIPINPNNHVGEIEVKNKLEATCKRKGYTGDTYCKGCGEKLITGQAIPQAPHMITKDFTVDKEATCITEGRKSKHCKYCNYTEDITIIPALGHDFKNGICIRCDAKLNGKWLNSGSRWWYRYDDGSYPANELCQIENTWYGFDAAGWMQTGWAAYDNAWYYFAKNGAMQIGWIKVGNCWYYLNSNGKMATGWLKADNDWYYLDSNGKMATGWLKAGNDWYYLNSNGKMATGWIKVGNYWYYLNADGKMATNTWIGNWYVNGSGTWVSSR